MAIAPAGTMPQWVYQAPTRGQEVSVRERQHCRICAVAPVSQISLSIGMLRPTRMHGQWYDIYGMQYWSTPQPPPPGAWGNYYMRYVL